MGAVQQTDSKPATWQLLAYTTGNRRSSHSIIIPKMAFGKVLFLHLLVAFVTCLSLVECDGGCTQAGHGCSSYHQCCAYLQCINRKCARSHGDVGAEYEDELDVASEIGEAVMGFLRRAREEKW